LLLHTDMFDYMEALQDMNNHREAPALEIADLREDYAAILISHFRAEIKRDLPSRTDQKLIY